MTRKPIKRWNTDPNASPEPTLVYKEDVSEFRKSLGLDSKTPAPRRNPDMFVREVHRCKRPGVQSCGVGSVWFCEECGLFSELVTFYSSRRSYVLKREWRLVNYMKQRRYERKYLR